MVGIVYGISMPGPLYYISSHTSIDILYSFILFIGKEEEESLHRQEKCVHLSAGTQEPTGSFDSRRRGQSVFVQANK